MMMYLKINSNCADILLVTSDPGFCRRGGGGCVAGNTVAVSVHQQTVFKAAGERWTTPSTPCGGALNLE